MLFVVPNCRYGPRRMAGSAFGTGVMIGLGAFSILAALAVLEAALVDASFFFMGTDAGCAAPNSELAVKTTEPYGKTRRKERRDAKHAEIKILLLFSACFASLRFIVGFRFGGGS